MSPTPLPVLSIAAAALIAAGSAAAQYKVVGPDGRVTYTDRPPLAAEGKVTAVNRRGGAAAAPAAGGPAELPFDLRQVSQRFPVTLYTQADCPPCDAGRTLLQQRGVPYAEKQVAGDDDAQALERAVGGRTVPSITIGQQALRGLSQSEWSAYLDAAGYPRESKLPRNWQPPAATPLVERAAPRTAAAAPPPLPPATPAEPDAPPTVPSGIRF